MFDHKEIEFDLGNIFFLAEHHVESPTAADQPRPRTCATFKEKFNGSIKISSATRDYVALQNVGNKVGQPINADSHSELVVVI